MRLMPIVLTLCLCSGCTSYHWLLRPGATGLIVDSQTGAPIARAQVVLSRDPKFYGTLYVGDGGSLYAARTLSATNGTFTFQPLQKQGVIDTVGPNDGIFYALSVRRDGYQIYTNTFWYPSGDYPSGRYQGAPAVEVSTNFDKIHLEKLQR